MDPPPAITDSTQCQIRVATPASVHTRDSSTPFEGPCVDFNIFGYTFTPSVATSESRHDRRPFAKSTFEHPPPYSKSHRDIVPSYTTTYEPATLAMYLFRFGFCACLRYIRKIPSFESRQLLFSLVFPPFWLMGTFILFSPLRAPPSTPSSTSSDEESTVDSDSWFHEKAEVEKEIFLSHMRKAELEWAKRCVLAFAVFTVITVIVAVVVFSR